MGQKKTCQEVEEVQGECCVQSKVWRWRSVALDFQAKGFSKSEFAFEGFKVWGLGVPVFALGFVALFPLSRTCMLDPEF